MKIDSVTYKTGSFADWEGKQHQVVACAVVVDHIHELMLSTPFVNEKGEVVTMPVQERKRDGHINRSVFIGFSVCNPIDTYNEEIGKKIAYNKALSQKLQQRWLATNLWGMIGTKVVEALLEQEIEYVCKNPGAIIEGYDQSKLKYEVKQLAQDKFRALPENKQELVSMLLKSSETDLEEVVAIAEGLQGEVPPPVYQVYIEKKK